MRTSALRERLTAALLDFAWDEWAQLGLLATPRRRSPWVQDPEALVVFTLEVARDDPRLFDEALDWLHLNEQLVSHRRLRSMSVDDDDQQLVQATLAWLASQRRQPHSTGISSEGSDDAVPLFRDLTTPLDEVDEPFAQAGWLRPPATPSGKSRLPDLTQLINLAFRLRHLLGVGARAEVARVLLTTDATWMTAPVVARAAGYNRRNVQEALGSLSSAGVVVMRQVGNEQRYAADRVRWAEFLRPADLERVIHRDWPQLLAVLRRVLRWLRNPGLEELSDYMLASETRSLLEDIEPDLTYAGIRVDFGRRAERSWAALEEVLASAIAALEGAEIPGVWEPRVDRPTAHSEQRRGFNVEITDLEDGVGWRLRAGNGRTIAASPTAFASEAEALDRAQFVIERARDLAYDIYREPGGTFRWRALAPNNELVAVGPSSFSSQFNAARALERLREGQPGRQRTARHVVPNRDGGWDVQAPNGKRASVRTNTQREAIDRAREIISNSGGGELVIHNRDGRIRERDVINAASDPHPPKPPRRIR
jgi:uncharacterized protein YegP (UPF0339 family)